MNVSRHPAWAEELKTYYLAGGSSFFILHGNVHDLVGCASGDRIETLLLGDFLASRQFASYDLVLHYDLGRGLRAQAGNDPARLSSMNDLIRRFVGPLQNLPRDPTGVLRVLDRLITHLLVRGQDGRPVKAAFLFDYGDLICPPGDRSNENLAILLNWARSPVIRRVNMIFVLMAGALSRLHPELVAGGDTTEIEVPLPDLEERKRFVAGRFTLPENEALRLARLSAGLTLANIDQMMRLFRRQEQGTSPQFSPSDPGPEPREIGTGETGTPEFLHDAIAIEEPKKDAPPGSESAQDQFLTRIKKHLIEAQVPGLIEFVEPDLDLSLVAGHTAAKTRLADDARLIREGRLEAVPMGYLICGPVGVGKTFIAMCYAGQVGLPCLTLRNFRSKYVGETEANLEKILGVLRSLGPVAVIVDEADASVGNRGQTGDSGTSSRVFAQLSAQMGDTRFRGKIIWFLLTCRPDLLPVDLKRQGRCEEHIPLFYPETPEDRAEMFLAMARKNRLTLTRDMLPNLDQAPELSGADIEGLLTRVRRESLLRDRSVGRTLLAEILNRFRSPKSPEHELQWLAAILECSDLDYLPHRIRQIVEQDGGLANFSARFRELKADLG